MNFDELKSKWNWKPIRNCSGRFVWSEINKNISPAEVIGEETAFIEFLVENAVDTVVVGRIVDGGLISYKKTGGIYLHTLNTTEGFERKLKQLGIEY